MAQADAPPVLVNPRTAHPAPRVQVMVERNGEYFDRETGEAAPPPIKKPAPAPAAARPTVNVNPEKAALMAEVQALIRVASGDESIKLGKAETVGIKALVASCKAQGCHPRDMLLDGLSIKTLTQARDELAAILRDRAAAESAEADLEQQMDEAIAGDVDPFAEVPE